MSPWLAIRKSMTSVGHAYGLQTRVLVRTLTHAARRNGPVGPEKLVAITGSVMLMASAIGKPHPSPLAVCSDLSSHNSSDLGSPLPSAPRCPARVRGGIYGWRMVESRLCIYVAQRKRTGLAAQRRARPRTGGACRAVTTPPRRCFAPPAVAHTWMAVG